METNDGWLIGRRPYFYRNPSFLPLQVNPPVQMIIRGDAFQNRQINIFGHSHRSITCYYVNPVEGHVPAFACSRERNFPITPRHPGRGTVRHRKPPYRS